MFKYQTLSVRKISPEKFEQLETASNAKCKQKHLKLYFLEYKSGNHKITSSF